MKVKTPNPIFLNSVMKNSPGLLNYTFILITSTLFASCAAYRPYYDKKVKDWEAAPKPDSLKLKSTVFLIGDAGEPNKSSKHNPKEAYTREPNFNLLRNHLYSRIDTIIRSVTTPGGLTVADTTFNYTSDPANSILFLGDNIYFHGLPPVGDRDREESERRLNDQLNLVLPFKGKKIFVPGNHDWDFARSSGLEYINRQEDYIEAYGDSSIVMLPSKGCPGPVEVQVNSSLVLIIIDSQWWLHNHEKPIGPENGCYVNDQIDFIVQLEDVIRRNNGKNMVIAMHHPLFSNGNHGGHYSLKDYFFPLTIIKENYYIPLPVIGSLYPFMRKYGISRQDISNPEYQKLKSAILAITEDEKNIVVVAGHEHSLQLFQHNDVYHVVSGSGCKDTYAIRGNGALFAHSNKGFSRLNYYENGEVWIEFWEPVEDGTTGKCTFRMPLYANVPKNATEVIKQEKEMNYQDSFMVMSAGSNYSAGKIKSVVWGTHYREVWQTPVRLPYLDMSKDIGGLTPLKRGGGKQTTALRLKAKDGNQYTLRSVNKDPAAILPEAFRKTFAADVVQDQISSSHPYGAMAIPRMAGAVGLYHTTPKLVYVPHTPLLGPYLKDIGGTMAMLEVHLDEDLSDFRTLGRSKNVVSTRTMFNKLYDDNDNTADNVMFLKARLFDMLIGDWDRHQDQWRWGEFEVGKNSIYRPIPRDRDQVFVKFDGILPSIVGSRWGARNLNNFTEKFYDLRGLNLNGAQLDRALLTEITKEDWIKMADSIKQWLPDSVIEKAIADLPPEIYVVSGPEIIRKLKARRELLHEAAAEYYEILAKEVSVVGSNKHELFLVERMNDDETRVRVYKQNKEGVVLRKMYERILKNDETHEVRLYGLEGNDNFVITGKVNNGLKVRCIGGGGKDEFIDSSRVRGWKKRTVLYDLSTEENAILARGRETKVRFSKNPANNEYKNDDFQYDHFGPVLSVEYNVDDGVFLGGGLASRKHGFHKYPAKMTQKLVANYAFQTGAYNIRYKGDFYSVFGRKSDLSVKANIFGPQFVNNYFLQGNNTLQLEDSIKYYRLRMGRIEFNPTFNHRITDNVILGIGPYAMTVNPEINPGTIFTSPEFTETDHIQRSTFVGIRSFSSAELVNDRLTPGRGGRWRGEINYYKEIAGGNTSHLNIKADLSFYIPFVPDRLTLGLRFGGATNIGSYKFYQANYLSGQTNLRGFRRDRFAGRTAAFQQTEIRFKMSPIRNYIFTGNWGVFGFIDNGRVWADNEKSKKIHTGFGPGIYVSTFEILLTSFSMGFSEEGRYFTINAGFLF
jgi:hypothetical protein